MARGEIFHPDFTPEPYWWEAYRPRSGELVDVLHYAHQQQRLANLNGDAQSGAFMVPRERQREEIASDYYYGGMVVERSASLHPALYYRGLLDACRRRDIAICAEASVERISENGG